VVERGSKVTFNGVEIGRVARIGMVDQHGTPEAKLTLDVNPRYISFSSPESPSAQRISAQPRVAAVVGGNGYSLSGSAGPLASLGAPNPWVYPDNLPRVNAHGGPDEPHRTRPTDPDRLRVGPPDRGEHHQSLMVDINSC
jgi:ABC-type transporter Mla subunit MlaD